MPVLFDEKKEAIDAANIMRRTFRNIGLRYMIVVRNGDAKPVWRSGLLSRTEHCSVEREDLGDGWQRHVLRFPVEDVERIMKKLMSLRDEALKLGFTEPRVERLEDELVDEEADVLEARAVVQVDVWHDPASNEWDLLATKTRTSADMDRYVITTVPWVHDEEIPKEFWERDFTCDHCQARRGRHEVDLVRNVDGRILQLGTSCVAKYMDGASARRVLRLAKLVKKIKKVFDDVLLIEKSKEAVGYSTLTYLAYVARSVRLKGYQKSRSIEPTWIDAEKMLVEDERIKDEARFKGEPVPDVGPLTQDFKTAREAYTWAVELEPKNDYEHNVKAVVESPFLKPDRRVLVVAASIPRAWELGKQRKNRQAEVVGFFGEVYERYRTEVRVAFWKDDQSSFTGYGQTSMYRLIKMVTREGHRLTWFTAPEVRASQELVEADGWCEVAFTVKEHKPFRGIPETKVTRLYFHSAVPEEPAEFVESVDDVDPNARQAPDVRRVEASERQLEVD